MNESRSDACSIPGSPQTLLQFGTGRFLRAFVDLFVHELNQAGAPRAEVVVVQSTGSDRAAQLTAAGGRHHVAIRGLEHGLRVDRMVEVASVCRALSAQNDWPIVVDAARWPSLAAVVSNTTEAGYALDPRDEPGDAPPRSFPAKLLAVLAARFDAGLPGLAILPCELLEHNAQRLRRLVLEQAARWRLSRPLVDWLADACAWCDTLVDRIVSAPRADDPMAASDPLFAVAEPFALWLVESKDVPVFVSHPAVRSANALEPYYLRKVRILNGAHTALVAKAMPLGFKTVREAMLDPAVGRWLEQLLFEEIVPTLEGRTDQPEGFARQCLERLANPFLEHRLADIALAHETKLRTRLAPTYDEFRARFGREPKLLGAILRRSG